MSATLAGKQRLPFADGRFADSVTFTIPAPALALVDIDHSDVPAKLADIAQYRFIKAQERGDADPVIVTHALLAVDRPAAQYFPGLTLLTESGEHLVSANSLIVYTLRTLFERGWLSFREGAWEPTVPQGECEWTARAPAVLHWLTSNNGIHLRSSHRGVLDFAEIEILVDEDVVPVARCGFLSDYDRRERPTLLFNSAFFLLEQEDIFHHHSALGEAHSFWAQGGTIQRPPIFRRGALWQKSDGRWEMGRLDVNDVRLDLPGGLRLVPEQIGAAAGEFPFTLNDAGPTAVTLYTRYFGVAGAGHVLGQTPVAPGRLELTIVDRRVVGWREGGGLTLPHNGLVVSLAPEALPAAKRRDLLAALEKDHHVAYHFAFERHRSLRQGIQAGPILLRDGRCPLTNSYLEDKEQFWPSRLVDGRWQMGVVPTNYKLDVDHTRAGRAGIGIDRDGDLIVVMVAGVNSGMGVPGVDSVGVTLAELAELLREAGAVAAVNLDGGGSTQAYFGGQQALVPGDRRGTPGRIYERMVPSVAVVR